MEMTVIRDNFLTYPDLVVEYAESLNFDLKVGNYPGSRTQNLFELKEHEDFAREVIMKTMSLLVNEGIKYEYAGASLFFQKVPSNIKHGVVHQDRSHTGIIYLNKNGAGGTSIYRPKTAFPNTFPKPDENIFKNKTVKELHQNRKETNSLFTKTIDIDGLYNRLIFFNGRHYHCANEYDKQDEEERLTLIFFIEQLSILDNVDRNIEKFRV